MDRKRQRKLEKKRARQKKRKSRQLAMSQPKVELAYHGKKFKTAELIPLFLSTETGILQSFIISGRKLTDHDVTEEIELLVHEMRRGPTDDWETVFEEIEENEEHPTLLTWSIHRNWQLYFEDHPRPSRDCLVGVLRTTLGSIESWKTHASDSRGYLNYIEGFLNKVGVTVTQVREDDLGELEEIDEDEGDWLLDAGIEWIHNDDQEAHDDFCDETNRRIRHGDGIAVAEICRKLLGEISLGHYSEEIKQIALEAERSVMIDVD